MWHVGANIAAAIGRLLQRGPRQPGVFAGLVEAAERD
jgi:hypothetical protein